MAIWQTCMPCSRCRIRDHAWGKEAAWRTLLLWTTHIRHTLLVCVCMRVYACVCVCVCVCHTLADLLLTYVLQPILTGSLHCTSTAQSQQTESLGDTPPDTVFTFHRRGDGTGASGIPTTEACKQVSARVACEQVTARVACKHVSARVACEQVTACVACKQGSACVTWLSLCLCSSAYEPCLARRQTFRNLHLCRCVSVCLCALP